MCVRVGMHHVAVAAIEAADMLGELEGASLSRTAAGSAPAFRLLRALVHDWLADATQLHNRCAPLNPGLSPWAPLLNA